MARIRVRAGGSEIEVDSRDFYVHNETVHSVIEDLSRYLLPLHHEPGVGDDDGGSSGRVDGAAAAGGGRAGRRRYATGRGGRGRRGAGTPSDIIRDAEIPEPELPDDPGAGDAPGGTDPRQLGRSLQRLLDEGPFFDSPRTASDVAQRLREDGCNAYSLAVSKALVRMSIDKKIVRHLHKGAASTYVSRG